MTVGGLNFDSYLQYVISPVAVSFEHVLDLQGSSRGVRKEAADCFGCRETWNLDLFAKNLLTHLVLLNCRQAQREKLMAQRLADLEAGD